MSNNNLPAHLTQANSWKRLFNERLQSFSQWDDRYQILGSVAQSALYKARQQLRSDTFHIAHLKNSYDLIINTRDSLVQRIAHAEQKVAELHTNAPQVANQAIKQARNNLREMIEQYNKQLSSLETSHRLLQSQRASLTAPISSSVLKKQVDAAHTILQKSRTSLYIGCAVNNFVEDVNNNVQHLESEIERVNALLASIYQRSEHGGINGAALNSKLLSIVKQRNHSTLR